MSMIMTSTAQRKHSYMISHTVFEIDRKYIPVKLLGKGAYGVVCSSVNRETCEGVAIKKIINVFENEVCALRILREIMLLRSIKHENVIALKDVILPNNPSGFRDVYIVYELMDTDLHHIISSPLPLTNDHCKYFMFQLLRGLNHLHSANIIHRDLKPGNLLVNVSNCELKICDLGLARTGRKNAQFMTEYVATRWYRAPELLLCSDNYGQSVDMWSVGCILAEMLGRKPLFQGKNCLAQLKLIMSVLGNQSEADLEFLDSEKTKMFIQSLGSFTRAQFSLLYPEADPLAVDLLDKLLVLDPAKRITAAEALCHPYMSGLYDPLSDPPAPCRINIDIHESVGEPVLREMMLREMLYCHLQAAAGVNAF